VKLVISRSELLAKLGPAAAIANRRSPYAYGACAMLRAESTLTIQVSAPTVAIRATAQAEIAKRGFVLLGAEDLLDRVKSLPDGPVELTASKDKLTIKAGSRTHVMATHDGAESFPGWAAPPANIQTIPGTSLSTVLRATYAASSDVGMVILNGVLLKAANDKLVAYAADGLRVASVSAPSDAALNVFVPLSVANVLSEIRSEHVEIGVTDSAIYLKLGDVELIYQRPAGTFSHETIANAIKGGNPIRIGRGMLASTIRGVTPDGTGGNTPVTLRAGHGTLKLNYVTASGDPSNDEIAVETPEEWIAIAEGKYLIEALVKHMTGDTVLLSVKDDDAVILQDDAGNRATVMQCAQRAAA